MPLEVNTVKIGRKPRRDYHHGALRPALLKAAVEVLEERGLDGFSLRETARRAGVSPAAPAHHFTDTPGLLTAIATASFVSLAEAIEAADAPAGRKRASECARRASRTCVTRSPIARATT